MLQQGQLRLYEAIIEDAPSGSYAPGTIVALDSAGLRIALNGASVLVRRIRLEPSGKKIAPNEVPAGLLQIGSRLA
jgi:methionyl-tRNA formyltransferase